MVQFGRIVFGLSASRRATPLAEGNLRLDVNRVSGMLARETDEIDKVRRAFCNRSVGVFDPQEPAACEAKRRNTYPDASGADVSEGEGIGPAVER